MSSLKGGATKLTSDLKSAAAGAAGAAGPKSEIEWTNYNYPPLILVMHFDLSELSDGGRKPVAWAHRSYLILLLGLLTNVVINIGLAVQGVPNKGLHCMYSFFNVIILGVAGLYGEYCAFKGVGDASSKMMRRFLFLQAAIAFLQMLFSVLKLVNWNGWMRMEEAAASVEAGPFWYYGTIVEASIFTLGYFVAGVAVWYMYTFDQDGPLAFSSKGARSRKGGEETVAAKGPPARSGRISRV